MLPTDHINTSPNYSRDAATNRLLLNGTDYTYDAAGQLVGAPAITGYHSLWYTAEGYLRSIDNYNTGSYLYNALGERTLSNHGSSGGWDLYVYLNSQPMADYDNTGTWTDNIYANGQKIARVANDPVNGVSTKYYLADQLGTTQMELDSSGNVLWQGAFTPFGQEIVNGVAPTYLGTQPADGTSNRYKFTGKERDNESGFDYFGARYYASGMGRWTTADWSEKPEAVPYSNLLNPQSLNLYVYVGNNPLSKPDLDGHGCPPDCTADGWFVPALGTLSAGGVLSSITAAATPLLLPLAVGAAAAQQIFEPTQAGSTSEDSQMARINADLKSKEAGKEDGAKDTSEGPKAAGAPGVTAGGQATDVYGNKIGPSGKPQVDEVKHRGKKGAKDAARNEGKGKPVKHPSPQKGDPHYHPTDADGEKLPTSTHHTY